MPGPSRESPVLTWQERMRVSLGWLSEALGRFLALWNPGVQLRLFIHVLCTLTPFLFLSGFTSSCSYSFFEIYCLPLRGCLKACSLPCLLLTPGSVGSLSGAAILAEDSPCLSPVAWEPFLIWAAGVFPHSSSCQGEACLVSWERCHE